MTEQRFFKELELGFRELFRILIPGAYAIGLFQIVAPDSAFSQFLVKSTALGLASTFFLGLIGYSLRVHERWFPFFWYFGKKRKELNNEIARIASLSEEDHVAFYKYFLETSSEGVSDRVHYFSSFYYMLLELSLFSVVAAYAIVAQFLFKTLSSVSPGCVKLAGFLIGIACVVQLVVLFDLEGIDRSRTQYAAMAGPVVAFLSLIVLISTGFHSGALSTRMLICGVSYAPLGFCIVSYLFWRLGDKHWKQVIGEQLILVNNKAEVLITTSKKYEPSSSGTQNKNTADGGEPAGPHGC